MEINILEKSDKEIKVEVVGEDHTFMNALKAALLEDKRVNVATYDIEFPTISDPVLHVMTTSKPIPILKAAAKRLIKQCDKFSDKFGKSIEEKQ